MVREEALRVTLNKSRKDGMEVREEGKKRERRGFSKKMFEGGRRKQRECDRNKKMGKRKKKVLQALRYRRSDSSI